MMVMFEKLNARQKRLVIAYIRALLGGRTERKEEQQNGTVQS